MTLFFYTTSFAKIKNTNPITKRIETYLTELEKLGFSGTVLVELDGKKVISKGYGFRNLELKEKNTTNTVFDIGSLTKQFTASAILKLEMQGKLKTTDTITKYFQNVVRYCEELRHRCDLRHGRKHELMRITV